MDILNLIYIMLSIITLLYIMFSTKKMDFIVIYYFSTVLYYFPAYFGKLYDTTFGLHITYLPVYNIDNMTYIILIFNMLTIIIWLMIRSNIYNMQKNNSYDGLEIKSKSISTNDKAVFILTIVGTAMMIYVLYLYKENLFGSNIFIKSEILDKNDFISSYFKYIGLFLFVYSFTNNKNKYIVITRILSVVFLLLVFRLGHRSYIIIGCVAVLFDYICDKSDKQYNLLKYVIKYKKMVVASLGLIFVALSIKNVTRALFTRDFATVLSRITDFNYYLNAFKLSEPNTITLNLNSIISTGFAVRTSTYIKLPFMIIPGIGRLIKTPSFNSLFQKELFSQADYNVASTYIGEAIANGGIAMFFIVLSILMILLMVLDYNAKRTKDSIIKTLLIISGIDLSFYIHRNSLEFAASRVRVYVYIFILLYFIKQMTKIISPVSKSEKDHLDVSVK